MIVNLFVWTLNIHSLIVLARVLLTWFPGIDPYHPVARFLFEATEPVLLPIRRFLQQQFPQMGPYDFSPMVLLILIMVIEQVIISAIA